MPPEISETESESVTFYATLGSSVTNGANLRGNLFELLLKVRLDQPPDFPGHSGADGRNGGRFIPGGNE